VTLRASLFVADCQGYELLTAAGVTVVELPDLADQARAANSHLDDHLTFGHYDTSDETTAGRPTRKVRFEGPGSDY
jgi:hypothetical protein